MSCNRSCIFIHITYTYKYIHTYTHIYLYLCIEQETGLCLFVQVITILTLTLTDIGFCKAVHPLLVCCIMYDVYRVLRILHPSAHCITLQLIAGGRAAVYVLTPKLDLVSVLLCFVYCDFRPHIYVGWCHFAFLLHWVLC